eukprot:187347-Pelagomonas_calceolata.AAC.2
MPRSCHPACVHAALHHAHHLAWPSAASNQGTHANVCVLPHLHNPTCVGPAACTSSRMAFCCWQP